MHIIPPEEEFEDTKRIIRIHKSKKDKQHDGQKKKDTQLFRKHTHNTKGLVTRTPYEPGVNSGAPEG
jgi:hypothetical protein